MTRKEARIILGVTRQEDGRAVKSKFRKLMTRCHPDAIGSESPEVIRRAQQINEAYSILCGKLEAGKTSFQDGRAWKAGTVERAFSERVIYRCAPLWEEQEKSYEEVARGKYEWDPDLEEFDCLLKSVNRAAAELLEDIEKAACRDSRCVWEESGWSKRRFACQARLFHLLASQFVRPVFCLEKLAAPLTTDGQGRSIYRFRAFLGCRGSGGTLEAMAGLKKGEFLKAVSLRDNRILVSNGAGALLGHLSLAEDSWYYVVIPILERRLAQVKFVVSHVEIKKNCRPRQARAGVDLYLRMEKAAKPERDCGGNGEIQALLDEYRCSFGF